LNYLTPFLVAASATWQRGGDANIERLAALLGDSSGTRAMMP